MKRTTSLKAIALASAAIIALLAAASTASPAGMARSPVSDISVTGKGNAPAGISAEYSDAPVGGWCWFSSPRSVYRNGKTYFGYIDNASESRPKQARVMVGYYDHASDTFGTPYCLHYAWEHDDHNNPALHVLPDGRIMACWTTHPVAPGLPIQCRITTNPGDISSWGPTKQITKDTWPCYPKIVQVPSGRLYVFYRENSTPEPQKYVYSDDNGATWHKEGITVVDEKTTWRGMYCQVTSRGEKIYIAGTPVFHGIWNTYKHIYWAVWDGSRWTRHDGATLSLPLSTKNMEQAFDSNALPDGEHTSLIWDLAVDSGGNPHVVFSHNLVDESNRDTGNHKYYSVHWNGGKWVTSKICDSNHGGLYELMDIYSGGVCLDHDDPNYAYCSVAVNGVLEIQRYRYSGGSWSKDRDVTKGSAKDNMRPVVPLDSAREIKCLYMHGDYHSYTDYDTVIRTFPRANFSSTFQMYFAEGTTREGFQEWLCIQNPGDTTNDVHVTFMFSGGTTLQRTYSVGPQSRASISINEELGPGWDVSMRLWSPKEFYAERPMYFDYHGKWTGGHCATGAASPQRDWYFAEGTTRSGFQEWLCIQNPNPEPVRVNIDYITAGQGTLRREHDIEGNSRASVFVNDEVGPDRDVSVHVSSAEAIVAERPMYFDYHGRWTGGHVTKGSRSPGTAWYFAEGTTRPGFEEWLAVQNPNDSEARLTCTFLKSDGSQQVEEYTAGANSRWTLDVNRVLGEGVDSALVVQSDLPVLAERPMYFCYKQGLPGYSWTGGHDVMGAGDLDTSWFFAEGCTYDWADEYICLANPGPQGALVSLSFMLEGSGTKEHQVRVAPGMRATVNVAEVVGRGHDVSTRVTSDRPVVAERPMYFNYPGRWTGGHDVVGFQ